MVNGWELPIPLTSSGEMHGVILLGTPRWCWCWFMIQYADGCCCYLTSPQWYEWGGEESMINTIQVNSPTNSSAQKESTVKSKSLDKVLLTYYRNLVFNLIRFGVSNTLTSGCHCYKNHYHNNPLLWGHLLENHLKLISLIFSSFFTSSKVLLISLKNKILHQLTKNDNNILVKNGLFKLKLRKLY